MQFIRERQRGAVDEEQVRLLTGFNDIFVTIAVGLLLFAVSSLAGRLAAVAGPAAVAAVSWVLAEYFTRQRRMALPSVVLLLAFVGATYLTVMISLSGTVTSVAGAARDYAALVAGGMAVLAAWLHWQRFVVPITVAAGAAAASLVAVALGSVAFASPSGNSAPILGLIALCGIAIFALAMWFDGRDRARVSRRSDVAFWLHLLAAPMVIHPVYAGTGLTGGAGSMAGSLIAVILFLAITALALAIDRRALIVSALFYVVYAIRNLVGQGDDMSTGFGITTLIIGLFLVLLSAAWRPARALMVGLLPPSWRGRLPQLAA